MMKACLLIGAIAGTLSAVTGHPFIATFVVGIVFGDWLISECSR